MNRKKHIEQLAKLTDYILGHHPDEFGLVPDDSGFIKIKEFLQVVTEINGWRHVRKNFITEMLLVLENPPIEVEDTRIRSKNHATLPKYVACAEPPKLLYTCVKQKSYPAVLENGIHPASHTIVICCQDPEMAIRIGKRRSPHPVLLTIHTKNLLEKEMVLRHAGNGLYLADFVPTECFTGPALPREEQSTKKSMNTPDPIDVYKQKTQAGTFTLSILPVEEKPFKGKKKDASWKNNKKRLRKEKKNFWPDQ